ncbi:MAG: hypothetical protein L0Y71_09190 [Gemmataceae bacterium]|nr:hypothetical protein [Gemmataceae bacterium]
MTQQSLTQRSFTQNSRRDFFRQIGAGMVAASVGSQLADELGFSTAFAADGPESLSFGRLEPLVALMQETPAARILPALSERLRQGTSIRDLVAAAALANSRAFGGEDYIGFHTLMAMPPALAMSGEMAEAQRALPVFKVLYRNTHRIQERGGRANEVLRPVAAGTLPEGRTSAEVLREHARGRNIDQAERSLAAIAASDADEAFNSLLHTVQDAAEVHRTVLAHRAWDLVGIIGREQALTLLRNSLRYCVRAENQRRYVEQLAPVRALLPRLLDQHRLASRAPGNRAPDDAWVQQFSTTLFTSTADQAADAVAAALAEGMAPDAIGEAISLAANQLVLRDDGRPANQAQPNRGIGSVHGDSIGVHASDSANAWRGMARVANNRNKAACLILAGYQVAKDRGDRGGNFATWQPYPRAEALERMTAREPAALLREAEDAIRNRDQARAAAAIHRYGETGQPARAAFDLLLKYAVSEDGALHAEKYYRTAAEDFQVTRAAFRWRHVVALARVTASAYGQPAPGYEEACRLVRG